MARLRQVYDSGAVVQLPFLTLDQLPPAALLNDPRLDYLPPGASLPEVRTAAAAVSDPASSRCRLVPIFCCDSFPRPLPSFLSLANTKLLPNIVP